jgi:exonuclease III
MDIEFGTWNVRTLCKTGSLKSLLHQIQQYQLNVTAIQEIRLLGKGIFDTRSHTVLYSGKEKGAHEAGVAFIVDKTIKRNILKFDPVNERDCVLCLKTRFFNHRRQGGIS